MQCLSPDRANWKAINTIVAGEAALIIEGLVVRYPDRTRNHLRSLVETGKGHSALQYLAAKAFRKHRGLVSQPISRVSTPY
jgi:hypothetical protein